MSCTCSIIPADVLERLSRDAKLPDSIRSNFKDTLKIDAQLRRVRTELAKLSRTTTQVAGLTAMAPGVAPAPKIVMYDCKHAMILPGAPVAKPASGDATTKRAFAETKAVADFYQKIFGRNSIDGAGMAMISSVHYGQGYNNAFWNGQQMTYGDGDGNIFVDFTASNDVIAHELTHGVTQHTAQFAYTNEAGGLNESMSDVFGSMFRQWRRGETSATADWLIGADIMGPGATKQGLTCLRDMADPAAKHCLAPQPTTFAQYKPGMDPHYSSGIPNLAFCRAAKAAGGRSWDSVGKIWYRVLTGYPANPALRMSTFASRTRVEAKAMFPGKPAIAKAIDTAWKSVGL